MNIDIISVFPEYFNMLDLSLLGKAQDKGLLNIQAHNLRKWTHDVHQSVDDTPVGGGAGMVMKPEVWAECLDELLGFNSSNDEISSSGDEIKYEEDKINSSDDNNESCKENNHPILIFPNPSAQLFNQSDATELSRANHLIFGCGRYEGYDSRIPDYYRSKGIDVREYSIGDYVLNGGEVAVSVMVEAITRLMPGFMGNPESIIEESYTGSEALLEHRQYTRPTTWRGISVPDVLTSGNHAKVDRFRRDEALERTSEIRPDLIEKLDCHALDKADRKTLINLGWEVSGNNPRKLSDTQN